jgi:hypothetical protein
MTTLKVVPEYENYGKCVSISNGSVELYVTVDVGPRIIKCGFIGGENIMFNDLQRSVNKRGKLYDDYYYNGAEWYIYGGHRLWLTPETEPETYYPDNDPVEYREIEGGAVFTPKAQIKNDVQLEIEITLDDDNNISVNHKITNIGNTDKEFAPWALTVMNQGGIEILEQNPEKDGLLPNAKIVVWPYTNLSDDRVYFGEDFITLCQDPTAETAFKLGLDSKAGRAFYILGETVFINNFPKFEADGKYADFGCNFETYTSNEILEVETLGKIQVAKPGQTVTHLESWQLRRNPGTPDPRDEEAVRGFTQQF